MKNLDWKEVSGFCPACGEEELRPIRLGNDKDGWQLTGDFECDSCGGNFRPFNNSDELEQIGGDGLEPDVYPEDDIEARKDQDRYEYEEDAIRESQENLDKRDDYQDYKDSEVHALNEK